MNIICDENHHYWINEGTVQVPGVTQILQAQGISDFSFVPEQLLDRTINYGNAVHDMTAYWDRGTLNIDILDRQLLPVLENWKKFLKDYQVELLPEWIEKVSYCEKWRYGFTPDRVGIVKGEKALIDIKTGTPSIATEIQTAAYRLGIEEELKTKVKRWVIYLSAEKYKVENLDKKTEYYPRHRSIFLSCLNIYNYKNNGG